MPHTSTQWRIALSMSRTTIPTWRIGPNNRLIVSLPPKLAVSSRHRVAHLADVVVVLLDHAELPGDQRSHIGRQVFLERARIGFLGVILAALAFGQDRPIVHPGDRRPGVH